MIITDLLAENFRKYQHLHLEKLPESGLIAVCGGNESGKSSIGDALCFVLFGRTDTLTGDKIGKLVRWGEKEVKITLAFSHKDRQYRLQRRADTKGVQTASLWDLQAGQTLADSTEAVAVALKNILGYGYPAFVRTFFWSQQVSEDHRTDTESLQSMAGVKTYVRLDEELRNEYRTDVTELRQLEAELKESTAAFEDAKVDQDFLPKLVDIRETLEGRQHGSLALTKNIDKVSGSYTENHGNFHRFNSWSRKIGWLASLGIILLILALLAWAVLTFAPDLLVSFWPETVATAESSGRSLLWIGVVLAGLTGLLMAYGWHLENNRLRPLREDSVVLASAIEDGSEQLNRNIGHFIGADAEAYLRERSLLDAVVNDSKQWQSDPEKLKQLAANIRTYKAEPLETIAAADGVSLALDRQNQALSHFVAEVDKDVISERGRVDRYIELKSEVGEKSQQVAERHRLIKVKQKGLQLIHAASGNAIRNFNKIVHQRCGGMLSDFTQDNYHNLEIDNDFTLRVLSEEKGDYLDFEEISAGTKRQIALAMRMSLANTLAESTGAEQQFIFLDEPFAFFDTERTTATINSLTAATSGSLRQVWITVQELPKGLENAFIVDCQQREPGLRLAG